MASTASIRVRGGEHVARRKDQEQRVFDRETESSANEPPLWIGGEDRQGLPVHPPVKEAASRIWSRVVYYVRKERRDVAEAAEILEEAVFSVSRRLTADNDLEPIRSIDSYLFHSFVNVFVRRAKREDRIQYYDAPEALDGFELRRTEDGVAELDNEILLKQVISAMSPRVREMFALRCAGHSWAEVGRQFGIKKHNAEVQFAHGLKKAKEKLRLEDVASEPRRRKK